MFTMVGYTKSIAYIPFSFANKYFRDSKLFSANSRMKGQSYAIEGNIRIDEKSSKNGDVAYLLNVGIARLYPIS